MTSYVPPSAGIWDGFFDAIEHYGNPLWESIGAAEGRTWDMDDDLHILPYEYRRLLP